MPVLGTGSPGPGTGFVVPALETGKAGAPAAVDGLAEFKVMVQGKDLEKAKDLLAAVPAADEENGSGKAG